MSFKTFKRADAEDSLVTVNTDAITHIRAVTQPDGETPAGVLIHQVGEPLEGHNLLVVEGTVAEVLKQLNAPELGGRWSGTETRLVMVNDDVAMQPDNVARFESEAGVNGPANNKTAIMFKGALTNADKFTGSLNNEALVVKGHWEEIKQALSSGNGRGSASVLAGAR